MKKLHFLLALVFMSGTLFFSACPEKDGADSITEDNAVEEADKLIKEIDEL